jgi:hypothetical protein
MAAGSATQRPAVTDWRSGVEDDRQQHRPRDVRRAMCGAPIREARYDRPDWPRCLDCGSWAEGELRIAWGDR